MLWICFITQELILVFRYGKLSAALKTHTSPADFLSTVGEVLYR